MGNVISGELKIEGLESVDDHYSLFEHFRRAVVDSGWCSEEEFMEELETILILEREALAVGFEA